MTRFEDKLKLLAPSSASERLRSRIAYPGRARLPWNWIVPMAAAAAGLLAVLFFVLRVPPPKSPSVTSDPDAERVMQRILDSLEKAPSLRVSFKREGTLLDNRGRMEKVETSGQASVKRGNRVSIVFTERRTPASGTPGTASFEVTSDGSHFQTVLVTADRVKRTRPDVETPSDLNARFARCLATLTIAVPQDLISLQEHVPFWRATEVGWGVPEAGLKTLTYSYGSWRKVKLWYDPNTLLPVKRSMDIDQIASLTETYSDWALGEEIPEENFKLKPEK